MGYGLWAMGYGLWAMGYGLWAMGAEVSNSLKSKAYGLKPKVSFLAQNATMLLATRIAARRI